MLFRKSSLNYFLLTRVGRFLLNLFGRLLSNNVILALVEGGVDLHKSFGADNLEIHGVDFANSSGRKIGKVSEIKENASFIS